LPLRALDRNAPSLTFRFSVPGVIRAIEAAAAKERTGGVLITEGMESLRDFAQGDPVGRFGTGRDG